MENKRFYEALDNSKLKCLEELAQSAGYQDDFNIMHSKILSMTNDENLTFWRSTGHLLALETAPTPRHRQVMLKYIEENPPRVHWNNEYVNLFTKISEDGDIKFVDCWIDKNLNRTALSVGKFPKKGEKGYCDDCNEETNRVLHLSTIRSKYPPLNPWKEIVGIPNEGPTWLYFLLKRSLDLGAGTMAYFLTKNPYVALGAIGLAEWGMLKIKESQSGESAFRKLGAELDYSAIDKLVRERLR